MTHWSRAFPIVGRAARGELERTLWPERPSLRAAFIHSGAARSGCCEHGAPRTCGERSGARMRDAEAASRPSPPRRRALARRREAHRPPTAPRKHAHRTGTAPPSRRQSLLRLVRKRGHVCRCRPRGEHEHRRRRCEREHASSHDKSMLRAALSSASSGRSASSVAAAATLRDGAPAGRALLHGMQVVRGGAPDRLGHRGMREPPAVVGSHVRACGRRENGERDDQ
jgi:hypothetical protein